MLEVDGSVVLAHDLSGQCQADARAVGFGGIERHKDLLAVFRRNGFAVVADVQGHFVVFAALCGDRDMFRAGLQGVLEQVDDDAADLGLVGIDNQVGFIG